MSPCANPSEHHLHLCPRGTSPTEPRLHRCACKMACCPRGRDCVPAWVTRLCGWAMLQHLTHGFAAPRLCPGMVTLCRGHPTQLADPLWHPVIPIVIAPFAQTHTHRGLASNASPCLGSDLLIRNSNKKAVLFPSPAWSSLPQGAGLCSATCPLLLPVFTWHQGDTHLTPPRKALALLP